MLETTQLSSFSIMLILHFCMDLSWPPHTFEFQLVKKILSQCIHESGKDTLVPTFEMSLHMTQQCQFLSNPTCVEATVYVPMDSQYIMVSNILSICLNVSNSSQTRCKRVAFANHYTFSHFFISRSSWPWQQHLK